MGLQPVPSTFNVSGNCLVQEDGLIYPIQKGQKSQSSHNIYKSGPGPV